jgi:hypothetical protein
MTRRAHLLNPKILALAALLLVCAVRADVKAQDQTFDTTRCANTVGDYFVQTSDATKSNWCRVCKADYSSGSDPTLLNTYGLQLRNGIDYWGAEFKGQGFTPSKPVGCYQNDANQYQCQFARVQYCELYDFFGRCSRCQCGYTLLVDSEFSDPTTFQCVPTPKGFEFCAMMRTGGICMRCKWNQGFSDDPAAQFYQEPHLQLDYGLFAPNPSAKPTCFDNTASALLKGVATTIPQCREYDTNGMCITCQSRLFDLNTNVEWDANVDPSSVSSDLDTNVWPFFNHRKVHFDYYLSHPTDTTVECKRYPTGYAGLPAYLYRIGYKASSGQDTNAGSMFSATNSVCKDFSDAKADMLPITVSGLLPNTTNPSAGTVQNGDFNTYLCAKSVYYCQSYVVEMITGDASGKHNQKNSAPYKGPTYWYRYSDTCKTCWGP